MTGQPRPLTVYDIRDTAAWTRTTDSKAHHERLLDCPGEARPQLTPEGVDVPMTEAIEMRP